MVYEDGEPVASVALDAWADPNLWTPAERAEPARYLHRLVVTRSHGGRGLGAAILDWACDRAASEGARWVRIDVWSDNQALQRYYLDHGFTHVRTLDPTQYPGYRFRSALPAGCAEPGVDVPGRRRHSRHGCHRLGHAYCAQCRARACGWNSVAHRRWVTACLADPRRKPPRGRGRRAV